MEAIKGSDVNVPDAVFAWMLDGRGGVKPLENTDVIDEAHPCWLHLNYVHHDSAQWLATTPLLPNNVRDALAGESTRPRVSRLGEGTLITLRCINGSTDERPDQLVAMRVYMDGRLIVSTRQRKVLALDDVVLVAHSMGCRVALQAAVGSGGEDPACAGPLPGLRGLVLVDGAYLTPRLLGDADITERQALAAQARARAAALYETAAPMERAARGFGQMFFDPAFDAVRDRMIERARALPPEVARTLMPDFAAWDVEHMEQVLPRLRVPVLAFVCTYMNSAHERVRLAAATRTPWIEALQQHVRALELVRVPGAGHFPLLEQPQAVHGRIEAWLQGLPAPGPQPTGSAADAPTATQAPRSVADTPAVPQGPSTALAAPPVPHP